ncbi:DUF2993 domain-containing protein [Microbacterium sp. NPDC078428]|uniref:DUF2993 domain-containing protein n=1 Tax=Microbacterium sp. NPDC078428 TaxID=3364190 RepID=UPI0037C76081
MSGAEHPTLPLPEPGSRWVLANAGEAPARRRRVWPWIVTLVIVAAVLVGGWFVANWLAGDLVERAVRTQVVQQLGADASGEVDVEVSGMVIPQLVSGELDELRITAQDLSFGTLSGDVDVVATAVPISADRDLGQASATVVLDEQQLRALLAGLEGFPADTVSIDGGEVAASFELNVFGAVIPIGVGLVPSAADGDLVLTPATLRLADTTISADDLRAQFGGFADAVLRSWDVCVAQYLPAALTMTDVVVADGRATIDFDIAPGVLHDPALRQDGTCG